MTVRPLPSASSATSLPSVAGRLRAGIARPGTWLAAPSSTGTGRPPGSRIRSGACMAFSLPDPRLSAVASLTRTVPPGQTAPAHAGAHDRVGPVTDIGIRDAATGDTEA